MRVRAMSRIAVVASALVAVLVAFGGDKQASVDEGRAKRAAQALSRSGLSEAEIVSEVADALDAGVGEVAVAVKASVGKGGRDPAYRYTHRMGFLVGPADRNDVATSIAWAMCAGLASCGDGESTADCRARSSQRFNKAGRLTTCLTENAKALDFDRYCNGGGKERARGTRMRLTPWQRNALLAELATHNLTATTVIDHDSRSAWNAALDSAGLSRCE